MNPDLVPMLLDVSIDPCDGSVHPSLQYVLIRGFTAMGWEQPRSASEDMAMEILKMIRPARPDAACGVREALDREESYLQSHFNHEVGGVMPSDIEGSFHRLREAALSTPSDAVNESAEARLREALNKLRNEVRGALSLNVAIRQAIGNTNFNCIQIRLDEADKALSAVGDEAKKSEGGLPEWDDVRGIAPNATGDLSSEAFIREQRDSWDKPSSPTADRGEIDQAHDWIKSTLGHGEVMCSRCCITNREAAVLGRLNVCSRPAALDGGR